MGFLLVRLLLVVAGVTWVVVAIAFLSGIVNRVATAEEWMIGTGIVIGSGGFFFALVPVAIAGFMLTLGAVVASMYGAGWVLAGGAAMVLLGSSDFQGADLPTGERDGTASVDW